MAGVGGRWWGELIQSSSYVRRGEVVGQWRIQEAVVCHALELTAPLITPLPPTENTLL